MIDHKCSPKVYVPVTPFERARSLYVALKGIWDSSSHPHVLWFWAVVELLVLFHTQPPVMLGCNADLKQWSPQEQEPHTIPHNTKHKVLPTFLCMYNACVTVCVHADLCVCVVEPGDICFPQSSSTSSVDTAPLTCPGVHWWLMRWAHQGALGICLSPLHHSKGYRLMYVIMLSFYVRVGMKQVLLCA